MTIMATSGIRAKEIGCKGMGDGEGYTETDGFGEPELFLSELKAVCLADGEEMLWEMYAITYSLQDTRDGERCA